MNMLPVKVVYQNVAYFIEMKMVAVLLVATQAVINQLDVGKVTNSGAINVVMDLSMLQTKAVNLFLKLPAMPVANNLKDAGKKVEKDAMLVLMTMNMLPVKVVYQNVVFFIEMKMAAVQIAVIQAVINQLDVGKVTNSGAINVLMDLSM